MFLHNISCPAWRWAKKCIISHWRKIYERTHEVKSLKRKFIAKGVNYEIGWHLWEFDELLKFTAIKNSIFISPSVNFPSPNTLRKYFVTRHATKLTQHNFVLQQQLFCYHEQAKSNKILKICVTCSFCGSFYSTPHIHARKLFNMKWLSLFIIYSIASDSWLLINWLD